MLPVFQGLTDQFVDHAVQTARSEGREVSCKAGCGACCRQLVPIAEAEAHGIARLVAELPEPRRRVVRERFAAARRSLEEAGLLDRLLAPETIRDEAVTSFGLEYFSAQVACPFLEAESCSIYPDRPIACREYLVTSPAEHCAQPTAAEVRCVKLPAQVSRGVRRLDGGKWVPLVLALEWSENQPEENEERTGVHLLKSLLQEIARIGSPGQ